MFIIPKSAEKCSLIFNCQLGNKKFDGPNPHMRLPNLYTLKKDSGLEGTTTVRCVRAVCGQIGSNKLLSIPDASFKGMGHIPGAGFPWCG